MEWNPNFFGDKVQIYDKANNHYNYLSDYSPMINPIGIFQQISGLFNKNDQLQNLVKEMRQDVKQLAKQLDKKQLSSQFQQNTGKIKKKFKKNMECSFKGCKGKYSSQIALNFHMRSKHGKKIHKNNL